MYPVKDYLQGRAGRFETPVEDGGLQGNEQAVSGHPDCALVIRRLD